MSSLLVNEDRIEKRWQRAAFFHRSFIACIILGRPVDRPSVKSASLRNSSLRRFAAEIVKALNRKGTAR